MQIAPKNPYRIFIGCSLLALCSWLAALFYATKGDPFLISLFSINDIDDQLYLTHAINMGGYGAPVRYYAEHQQSGVLLELLLAYPNSIVDFVVGGLARLMKLSPPILGLMLDIITIPLVFFSCCILWYRLTERISIAIYATVIQVFLAAPLNIYQIDIFKIFAFDGAISSGAIGLNHIPVLRSVYTQLSLPFFLASISLLLGFRKKWRDLVILGILCGSQIYIYYFAFAASIIICTILLFFEIFEGAEREESICCRAYRTLKRIFVFLVTALVVSSFGFYIIFSGSGPQTLLSDPLLHRYWFFSGEAVVILISSILIWRLVKEIRVRRVTSLLVAVSGGYLLIMNFQPVLGIAFTPFTISKMFLFPLTAAAIGVLWGFGVQKALWNSRQTFPILCSIIIILALVRINNPLLSFAPGCLLSQDQDLREFISFINSNTSPEEVFVPASNFVGHYSYGGGEKNGEFDFGAIISAFGDRPILMNYLTIPPYIPLEESVDRARFHHLLIEGEEGAYFFERKTPSFPGSLFTGTVTAIQYLTNKILTNYYDKYSGHPANICQLSKKYHVDYLVLDSKTRDEATVKILQGAVGDIPLFTSSLGKIKVWKLDKFIKGLDCT